uniref:Uncharacterized protein n=1 Tax=Levilinea saccharolytica TaxID=229921 RepID=A0A0N0RD55_9CHLR|nr:hypothetical protein LSAC_03533 [Levilinea saccharolytica]
MNENDDTKLLYKIPIIIYILTAIVFLLIFCICIILVLFLVFGQQLIYIL